MADDTGTDWAALADKLDREVDMTADPELSVDLRAAAAGLRRLARLDTAHQELLAAISRAEEWAMSDEGFRERVNLAVAMYGAPAAVLGVGEQPEGPTCPSGCHNGVVPVTGNGGDGYEPCPDSWHGEQR